MIRRKSSRTLLALTLCVLASASATAQVASPGPEHALLATLAGDWEGPLTLHVPGMDPVSSPSSQTNRVANGGFWLIGDFEGTMMGMEFTGHSVLGYDPGSGKWVESWVSNLAPEMTVLEGEYDEASRTWSKFRPDAKDIFTGAPAVERHQLKLVSDDSYVLTIAQKADGGEFQVLVEIEHTRKK